MTDVSGSQQAVSGGVPAVRPVAAICHRCGGVKKGPFVPCKACGHVPQGIDRQVGWLFSEHHLDQRELEEAARRIREGERPDPPQALLDQARVDMGAAPLDPEAQRPLRLGQVVLLMMGNLLLTPLVGMALWWGWKEERPVASRQSLLLTLPVAAALGLLWLVMIGKWTIVVGS